MTYPTIEVFVETEVKGSPLEALLDEESYQGLMREAQETLQQFCTDAGRQKVTCASPKPPPSSLTAALPLFR
jgi:hypothetical protein